MMIELNRFGFPYRREVRSHIAQWSYRPSYYVVVDSQIANVSQTINQLGGTQINTTQTSVVNNVK